jgi:Winged helix DNA-binding domain
VAPPEGSTLTQRQLNRALLARQFLLERGRAPLPRLLESVGGIQAQYAPAMYVGVWSRLADFERADLTRALEKRQVAQGTLLRSTIHLVSAEDYWPFALGVRAARQAWFIRSRRNGPTVDEVELAAAKLREALADGPIRQAEIDRLLSRELRQGVGLWLDMVRVPPSGTWERRRADLYGLAEDWLGPPDTTVDESIELLVRRYLGGFGPASRAEISSWSGLPVTTLTPVVERMRLRRFHAEDGAVLLDLPEAPLPAADTAVPVRFLPTWDATLLVHARRSQILPEEHRTKVFNSKNPHAFPTFLVDGSVRGTWRYDDRHIEIEEFDALPQSVRRQLADEGERLAAFHA